MENPNQSPEILGSITPSLEGAPSTLTHENRHKSVIPEPAQPREEGAPSRP
ncbi:MAG: hypothetical protein IKY34_04500 [Ruminiclostridium sp.]|nr:hypothetical protein [Ruminiclostridium sp.]